MTDATTQHGRRLHVCTTDELICELEVVAMTDTATKAPETGLFETKFSIGAAAVGVVFLLFGLVLGWTGYQGDELLFVGVEMNVVSGMAGLLLTWFFGVVALLVAAYMEPGFDR
ncbi:hypothetical protein [Halobiforma nitratireducens]|uniref:Uncharacterized protein n=1 Tax=Halobiforma nitratireducens JCM 10879 TaxID=1227454 RepID=M0L3F1_9EURY|nr:hypothetical protein [Halobiforma nitratireducens]EMA28066.1 hypothetical protein C446_17634 [Halobiforma nitratireducens JCM 10879]